MGSSEHLFCKAWYITAIERVCMNISNAMCIVQSKYKGIIVL